MNMSKLRAYNRQLLLGVGVDLNFLLRKGLLLLAGNESSGGDSKNSDGLHD